MITFLKPQSHRGCDRIYCNQTKSSEIAVMSHCGPSTVSVWSWSVAQVFVAILVAVRNFEMFKIPHCDFSIAMHSVCCLSALAQLVLWSQYDLPELSMVALLTVLGLRSI